MHIDSESHFHGPWGSIGLQMASKVTYEIRFELSGLNCLCSHASLACNCFPEMVETTMTNYDPLTCVALLACKKFSCVSDNSSLVPMVLQLSALQPGWMRNRNWHSRNEAIQFASNFYTHIDGDPRQLENGDLLILIAGDEPKELVAVLSKRISLIIYIWTFNNF